MNYKRKNILPILFLLLIPIWIFWISNIFLSLPNDWSYEADLFSIDNFYNEENNEFFGEARSVTKFSYQAIKREGGVLDIENVFDVRTVTGDPIFSVERIYGIDPASGMHVQGYGDKDREGYLFGPKDIKEGESFIYWHINYDGPAKMNFVNKEILFGLPVYHYESSYENVVIDQTENLTNLPEVGLSRGVRLEPNLELWIEPTTGYLVKYSDRTNAYYYDLETGEYLNPWNQFSNTYQRSSVIKHVENAKKEKLYFQTIQLVIPIFLLLTVLVLFFLFSKKKKIAFIIMTLGALGLGLFYTLPLLFAEKQEPVKIGISRWVPLGNPAYDENIQGFKDALAQANYIEGENIVYYDQTASGNEEKQENIARSFLDQEVDLIYSLTTPGTAFLKEMINDKPIVFSIVTYPVESGLIDSLKNSGNNLVGTRNWVPVEEQLSVFTSIASNISSIGFLHREGESNSEIQLEEMTRAADKFNIDIIHISGSNLEELTNAIKSGPKVDALFSACDTLIQSEAEEMITTFAYENKIPSFSCNVTGPPKGDLVGTVADFYQIGKLAGEKAVLILEGATPSSLETQTITRPFIYINQKTADYLNLRIPQDLLARAKKIIQ